MVSSGSGGWDQKGGFPGRERYRGSKGSFLSRQSQSARVCEGLNLGTAEHSGGSSGRFRFFLLSPFTKGKAGRNIVFSIRNFTQLFLLSPGAFKKGNRCFICKNNHLESLIDLLIMQYKFCCHGNVA